MEEEDVPLSERFKKLSKKLSSRSDDDDRAVFFGPASGGILVPLQPVTPFGWPSVTLLLLWMRPHMLPACLISAVYYLLASARAAGGAPTTRIDRAG